MKSFINICFALLLVSCYDIEKPKKPKNLIGKDNMVNIIIDMSLFNSAKGVNKKTLENKGISLEQFIYEKHNIDSLQFATSNNYYAYHVKEYEVIYDRVKDSLTELNDKYNEIDTKRKKAKKKRDSIRREKKRDSMSRIKKGMRSKKKGSSILDKSKKKQTENKKNQLAPLKED